MKTGWKVVGIIVAVLLLLGAVGIGVGVITGGDTGRATDNMIDRAKDILDSKDLDFETLQIAYETAVQEILPMLMGN